MSMDPEDRDRLVRVEVLMEAVLKGVESHGGRIAFLEAAENKRKGGMVVLTAMMGAAGVVGGIVAKAIPWASK